MKTTRGVQAILDLEDRDTGLLSERLPGAPLPFWPQVRMSIAGALAANELNDVPAPSPVSSRWAVAARALRAQLPSRADAASFRASRDLCFVVSGVTVAASARGERNWLIGDVLDRVGDRSVVLQWNPIPGRFGRPAFRDTRTLDPLEARADRRSRASRASAEVVDRAASLVRAFAAELDADLTDDQLASVARYGVRVEELRPHLVDGFSAMIDRIRPRVVVLEDASYGTRASLVHHLAGRGIPVVEPQHGWIGPSHAAYNFGAAMSRPELAATLPSALLTFGEAWSDSIRHPARTVAVGKPHLEAMSRTSRPLPERPRQIVVVSSVAEPEKLDAFTRALRRALPADWRVLLRPHPSERALVAERYPGVDADPGIEIDTEPDVYDTIRASRGVVGVASTVLFEALGLGAHVFALESGFSEYYLDDSFGEPVAGEEGARRVAATVVDDVVADRQLARLTELWSPDAAARFVGAVERIAAEGV